jgi:hypothetical protein
MLSTRFVMIAVWILALASASAQVVPLTNDECVGALEVTEGVNPGAPWGQSGYFFTNVGATSSFFPSGTTGCFAPAFTTDVWFKYVATGNGPVSVGTCNMSGFSQGSLTNTKVEVRVGACPYPVYVDCNDDFCGLLSQVTFTATSGTTYYIRVGGGFLVSGNTGTFYLKITGPPLPNDGCSGALPLTYGGNGPYSNVAASDGSVGPNICSLPTAYRDLWFSLTATNCGLLRIDTCGTPMDTTLQVFSACGGAEVACNDDAGGSCGDGSSAIITATIGATYRIRVSSYLAAAAGNFWINVTIPDVKLAWSSPLGPGSLQAQVTGPLGGTYFVAVTLVPGAFPNGWLFGLDISYPDLAYQLGAGFPFTGALDACGSATIGPFQGLPSGLTIFALAFGFPLGSPVPSSHSAPTVHAVN